MVEGPRSRHRSARITALTSHGHVTGEIKAPLLRKAATERLSSPPAPQLQRCSKGEPRQLTHRRREIPRPPRPSMRLAWSVGKSGVGHMTNEITVLLDLFEFACYDVCKKP